jgi:hypothetical protein
MKVESEVVRVAMVSKLYLCPVIDAPFKYLLFSSERDGYRELRRRDDSRSEEMTSALIVNEGYAVEVRQ